MSLVGDDCFFFYNTTCTKGPGCPYRHVEEARNSDTACPEWMVGKCGKISCPFRHAEMPKTRQNVPCYYESQASGCTKPHCPFLHKFPKPGIPPPNIRQPVSVGQPSIPPPGWPPNVRPPVMRGPPPVIQGPPPERMWAAPPVSGPPPAFLPGRFPLPVSGPPEFGTFHRPPPGPPFPPLVQVEPVIINLNSEESDQDSLKGSPMKPRTIVPPLQQSNKVENPLDYFLNAKPWVDPNLRYRRSPSPPRYVHRNTPSPSPGSKSPVRTSSPRRSLSPRRSVSPVYRRRSISVDRGQIRRRSGSLDRSRSISPDWKDKRRIARRSRSPSPFRRRSKSPNRDRFSNAGRRGGGQDLRSRLKPVSQTPKFEEIKLSGPKIVSLKKEKKEEEEDKKSDDETPEDTTASKTSAVNEEVKSLEEIYRERALKSMMDAKRKRILEQKKKRWEAVKKTSESEKSDEGVTKDKDKQESQDIEKEDKGQSSEGEDEPAVGKTEEEVSSSDSHDEGSDLDLAEDVDIELDAGDLEVEKSDDKDEENTGEEQDTNEAEKVERKKKERTERKARIAKSSIKSRLGLKAVADVTRQAEREQKDSRAQRARSVKERLGLRSDSPIETSNRPIRSGVIKLNKSRQTKETDKEVRITRNLGGLREYQGRKSGVVLPRITIHNRIEERKSSIKQRLGLLEEESEEGRKNKKWKEIDEELCKLLIEEDVDIDASELDLLTKKEKKKLLKKLLTSQGREDDYDYIVKKKKKKTRRRERDYEDERFEDERERQIKIQDRLGPSPNPSDWTEDVGDDALRSGDEIDLEEKEEEPESPASRVETDKDEEAKMEKENGEKSTDNNIPVRSLEEIRRDKEERLRRELEPVSLEEIRKKRALKRIHAGGDADNKKIEPGKESKRRVIDESAEKVEKNDPPVHVTFKGDLGVKRRLSRIGEDSTKNENTRPTLVKTFKRERQIYVPPTSKKEAEQKINPEGRDVIDYGDMFGGKKPENKDDPPSRKISAISPITMSSTTETLPARKPLRLNRGPPKVEVKDATVKTFAEIMAEKKRKRLLAQQAEGSVKKPYTPISFVDSGNKAAKEEKASTDVKSRLSTNSVEECVQIKNSPTAQIQEHPASISSTDLHTSQTHSQDSNSSVKVSRWKRRKTNPEKSQETTAEDITPTPVLPTSVQSEELSSHKLSTNVLPDEDDLLAEDKSILSRSLSKESDKSKRESTEDKKQKLSDSFFDDDLLMDDEDIDLDLANTVDHDELMREMDELLS